MQLFIKEFYEERKQKIASVIKSNDELLREKSKIALAALLEIMDYQFDRPINYQAIPTILPYSPFQDSTFYFSILGEINNRREKNVLVIGIHEISHYIFYELLKPIEMQNKESLPLDLKNYLKEALAAVIMNRQPLKDILEIKHYPGNPEIQNLQIETPDHYIKTLVDFLDEHYETIKIKEKKTFFDFLAEIINIL